MVLHLRQLVVLDSLCVNLLLHKYGSLVLDCLLKFLTLPILKLDLLLHFFDLLNKLLVQLLPLKLRVGLV